MHLLRPSDRWLLLSCLYAVTLAAPASAATHRADWVLETFFSDREEARLHDIFAFVSVIFLLLLALTDWANDEFLHSSLGQLPGAR